MAEIFPDEGLNLILNIFPKGGTNLTTTYLALFTAFTASTVGSSSQTRSSYTETTFGGYVRVSVASTDWGTIAAGTGGRAVPATQKTFATATGTSATAINGFFLADASTTGTCVFAANFDDVTAISSIAVNDVVKVTPTIQYNN